MLINFADYTSKVDISCDVCIVGSGAAGSVLYDHLSKARLNVVLVESGGLEPSAETQQLNEGYTSINGSMTDRFFSDLVAFRSRALGGTTGLWSGECEPFHKIDFITRPWVPNSGWPIDESELSSFYSKAKEYVQISWDDFDERVWEKMGMSPPFNFNFKEISTNFIQRSGFLMEGGYLNYPGPINFKRYITEPNANRLDNRVFYNATLTDLKSNESGRVEYGEISGPDRKTCKILAKAYVLAAGGFENPRILLNANRGAGIGNESDCVGRYYLGHPNGIVADLICPSKEVATRLFWAFQHYKLGRNRGQPHLAFKAATQKERKLLSSAIYFLGDEDSDSAVYKDVLLQEAIRTGNLAKIDLHISDLTILVKELEDVVSNLYRKFKNTGVRTRILERMPLYYLAEQVPNRESRIYLSNHTDKFGLRKLVLDWHLAKQDTDNILRVLTSVAKIAKDLEWGRLLVREQAMDGSDPLRGLTDAAHPSGTTRMSNSVKTGVVDKNLKVHSVKNLFVCSSSVFPTNSYVSPTFTISALAIRLAAHLGKTLA